MMKYILLLIFLIHINLAKKLTYNEPGTYTLTSTDYENAESFIIEMWSGGGAGNNGYGGGSGAYYNGIIKTLGKNFTLTVSEGGSPCRIIENYKLCCNDDIYNNNDCDNGNATVSSIINENINITLSGGKSYRDKLEKYDNYYVYSNEGKIISRHCVNNNCYVLNEMNGNNGTDVICLGVCYCVSRSYVTSMLCKGSSGYGGDAPIGGKGGCCYTFGSTECDISTGANSFACQVISFSGTNGSSPGGGGGAIYILGSYTNIFSGKGGDGRIIIYYEPVNKPINISTISTTITTTTTNENKIITIILTCILLIIILLILILLIFCLVMFYKQINIHK